MDGGFVAVRSIFVAHARRKMDASSNFFVEQNVAHRREHKRVEADCKLTHIASAFVRIEDGVQALVVARFASRFDNLALLEDEANVAELLTFVKRRRIVMDHAFDTPLHRSRIDFTIRDVHVAAARHRRNVLDAERDVGILSYETHFVRLVHEIDQSLCGTLHFRVIGKASLEVEVFERFRTHLCALSHRRVWPAEHAPTRIVHAVVQNVLRDGPVGKHFLVVDVAVFHRVVHGADGEVGLHLLHFIHRKFCRKFHLFFGCRADDFAADAAVVIVDKCVTAHFSDRLDKFSRKFIRRVGCFN